MSSLPTQPDATITVVRTGKRESIQLTGATVQLATPDQPLLDVPLGLELIQIGTGPECDLVASDPAVSRVHCTLRLTQEGLLLRDSGSKNGTFVAGVRVREVILPLGVRATLGSSELWAKPTNTSTEVPLSPAASFGKVRGASVAMRALFAKLERAAQTDEPVLLEGESGTGKELLARALHEASQRRSKPFVVLECASLNPQLVEAELFGTQAGAFTGAHSDRVGLIQQADGGTLYLDELSELPLEIQTRLLRALETKEIRPVGSNTSRAVNFRVISSTQRDIRTRLAAGEFRKDLFYRLGVLLIRIPALRERGEDLLLLVKDLLAERDPPRDLSALPPGTLELFRAHHWPGNVRELRNAVARLFIEAELEEGVVPEGSPSSGDKPRWTGLLLAEARAAAVLAFERGYVERALAAHQGNVTSTARSLGVTRQTVHRLLRRQREKAGDDD
jgi:transcriptional regulator with PAS, ATPase and Fis domain